METLKHIEAVCEEQKRKDEEEKEKIRFQEIMKQRERKLNKQTKPYEIIPPEKKEWPRKKNVGSASWNPALQQTPSELSLKELS